MNGFKEWFLQQSSREQLLLGVGAIAIALFLVYAVIWAPLAKSRNAQAQANIVTLEQREEVRRLAGLVLGQQQNGGNSYSESLTQVASNSLKAHGLPMDGFQPNGDIEVKIRIKSGELSRVFAWLDEMENKKGIQIKDVSVTSTDDLGFASISNVTLHRE